MEEKIKELIEKYTKGLESKKERYGKSSYVAQEVQWVIDDLQSLLKYKQVEDVKENVITVSLNGINNRTNFRHEIEELYKKYTKR